MLAFLNFLVLWCLNVESTSTSGPEFHLAGGLPWRVSLHSINSFQLGFRLLVGGQPLLLALDSKEEGIRLFQRGTQACEASNSDLAYYNATNTCYSPTESGAGRRTGWCSTNRYCIASVNFEPFPCTNVTQTIPEQAFKKYSGLFYDGIEYTEERLEGFEEVGWEELVSEDGLQLQVTNVPVKLVRRMDISPSWGGFKNADGIFGIAGDACRPYMPLLPFVQTLLEAPFLIMSLKRTKSADDQKNDINNEPGSQMILSDAGHLASVVDSVSEKDNKEVWSSILWSEPRSRGLLGIENRFAFDVYHLSTCNASLLSNDSSHWTAILDFSSQCLVVPEFLLHRLSIWLPLDCPHLSDTDGSVDDTDPSSSDEDPPFGGFSDIFPWLAIPGNDSTNSTSQQRIHVNSPSLDKVVEIASQRRSLANDNPAPADDKKVPYPADPRLCSLKRNLPLKCRGPGCDAEYRIKSQESLDFVLPSLSFQLSESGEKLQIDLEKLVFFDEKRGQELLCVAPQPADTVAGRAVLNTMNPMLGFGISVMSQFTVVADQKKLTVGFVQQKDPTTESLGACASRPNCFGDQKFDERTNKCLDPECSLYFLMTLDETKGVCCYNTTAISVLASSIIGLVVFETIARGLHRFVLLRAEPSGW